ncbi:MAG: NADH-quinone oxidoreductase subunit H [Anaerolineales bacterium]|jgi:NADH-quinone oxidoreductase subunit H|uniref:complex I subunit 1 family protein n=1 Tax=Candidatus Villigracilis vicinus TaxID=3140679 RepID=UPI003134D74B|nr:NADH-quinone oxidoreductase subunit H [Anaerolineales bacterium]MBK7448697.1 NADH-quinone oxidoreductase subunit H [Anaerolineales bacterium]MBK9782695.1 NADH-quinone oxidoreductase subunit H [Anaerolineales bacterium]
MSILASLFSIMFFPAGVSLILSGMLYEWADRKLVARFQNRIGPRWFQPLADTIKLISKEEIQPQGVIDLLFHGLPIVALTGALTAALYTPILGFAPIYSFQGDLIVTLYLLSLLTMCTGLAGWNGSSRFSLIGATRSLTQLFAYEAPFLLALLGPAMAAGTWVIKDISAYAGTHWMIISQPVGFVIALIGLMGKLELPPFDAPEAETEIVAGALTEYSGRGLALFHIGKSVELVVAISLVTAFYLGGIGNPLIFLLKTLIILLFMAILQSMLTRLRIDQTVGMWWRFGALLALLQILVIVLLKGWLS